MPNRTTRRLRRTWPQRLVLTLNVLLVLVCLSAAALVWYGNNRLGALQRVTITHNTDVNELTPGGGPGTTAGGDSGVAVGTQNFLLVGSDSRKCGDPNSPYAGAFASDPTAGARSDTIMVVRIDPAHGKAAILSFPRDLWVRQAGSNRKDRINASFDPDDPSKLVQTIEQNFGVKVDHYVDVDFCAFQGLVDAVGGVRVPFAYPTRDKYTGLNIAQPGCVLFNGEAALAYVRSRHYEWFDGKKWQEDSASDFGRIARQQDFIRRSLQRAIDKGARRPTVAKSLLDTALQDVRVDSTLTINDMLHLANSLKSFDPGHLRRFRLDGSETIIGGADVILPDTTSPFAKSVLSFFQGKATLADVPQDAASATTAPPAPGTATTTTTATTAKPKPTIPGPTTVPAPTSPAVTPTVTIADNPAGVYPPDDPSCA